VLKGWGWKKLEEETAESDVHALKCVVVTGCTVGIAHTYMAAEAMERAARRLGIEATVEAQGRAGTENEASAKAIEGADFVIIASDIEIEGSGRFEGKVVYRGTPADAIKHPERMYEEAVKLYREQAGA
jgi:fructose-specific phosphotransferase system IIB component